MKIQLSHTFGDIICLENLLSAWQEFIVGKKSKSDVQIFVCTLMDNIISLHDDLKSGVYYHGGYQSFFVNDPKRRHIHKASVRDRLVHHAIYRVLYPFFERTFIGDSYSCRLDKGTHRAINRFRALAYKVSQNNTRTCWVLKCDIRKFFASINHKVLLDILNEHIPDKKIMWLLEEVVKSFNNGNNTDIGLPLGNLTSQLFANVYMNVFDQFVKHKLKAKYYIRYADDFVILSDNKLWLDNLISPIQNFLSERLELNLHPDKVFLQTIASGVDFLGWVNFTDHRVLRAITKRRMMRRMEEHMTAEVRQSYLGLLSHGNAFKIQEEIKPNHWF